MEERHSNTGQIIKSRTTERFTHIPNEIAQTKNLTSEEKGFLLYLLSLPSNWVLYRENLYQNLGDKPGTVDRLFKQLQKKRYILSVKVVGERGRFTGWNHIVYDSPTVEFTEMDEHRAR